MKIKFTSGTLILIVCLLVASAVSAESNALPGGGWQTGIQVQNVGGQTAQIVLTGYDAGGDTVYTDTASGENTAAGASVNYVTFPEGAATFQGAGVVSSDQPIVAIVNVNNAPVGLAAGQYQGTSDSLAGLTVQFPLVKSDFYGKCTLFYVQNAGGGPAVINGTFSEGTTWTSGAAVDAGDMVIIDPVAAGVPSDAPYALTVDSTEELAGTVLEFNCTADPATAMQATRGFTPLDGSMSLLAPIYKYLFYDRSNGLQVMNVSGAPADITVTYAHAALSAGSGTYTQQQLAVPDGASVTFFKNTIIAAAGGGATSSTGTPLAAGSLTAATVTATGNVVAIVNESNDAGRQFQTTYSAIALSEGGSKVAVPLAKEEFYGKTTGIQIQNAGSAPVTVQVTYEMNLPAGAACLGTYVLEDIAIDVGSSVTLYRPNASIPAGASWDSGAAIKAGCFGGATVEVVGAGSVVAVVQEPDINTVVANRQDTKNYEGFKIE